MKRYIVYFETGLAQWVWANNKRDARQQMSQYAACTGRKITEVKQVKP